MAIASSIAVKYLHDSFPAPAPDQIEALARFVGQPLPSDYLEFLHLRNAGEFFDQVEVPIQGRPDLDTVGLTRFFGIDIPFERSVYEIAEHVLTYYGRVPAGMLPIADAYNDLVLLSLRTDRPGVFLWARDDELRMPIEDNAVRIAPTFSAFVEAIRLETWRTAPIERHEPFISAELHHNDSLRAFLAAKGNPNLHNEFEESLLVIACRRRNYEGAVALLACGANPNATSVEGYSCAQLAALAGFADLLKLLFAHGAQRFSVRDLLAIPYTGPGYAPPAPLERIQSLLEP